LGVRNNRRITPGQANTCHPRESGDPAVVTGRSGNASREVVESGAKRANRVVATWMLAFAIVTRRARRLFRETSAVDALILILLTPVVSFKGVGRRPVTN